MNDIAEQNTDEDFKLKVTDEDEYFKEYEEFINNMRKDSDHADERFSEMNSEIKALNAEMSQLVSENKELENDLTNLKKRFQQMMLSVNELSNSLETLNKSILETSKCIPKKEDDFTNDSDDESEHETVNVIYLMVLKKLFSTIIYPIFYLILNRQAASYRRRLLPRKMENLICVLRRTRLL